jgi:hypothetical protein
MSAVEPTDTSIPSQERPEAGDGVVGILSLLRLRDFRLLFIGESVSLLGDQFSLIALPWLVLQMTGDALAMGTVLALAGVPRALFMLVGGALTDRLSPRSVMLASNLMRMVLVSVQAALVLTGRIELWMVYLFALGFGAADAFYFPGQSAIVPQLVERERLQPANSLVQGVAQLSQVAGPVVAGAIIALLGSSSTAPGADGAPDLTGIGLAFCVDALTFVASVATLWLIRPECAPGAAACADAAEQAATPGDLLAAIGQGIRYVWRDDTLRWVFIIIGSVDFLLLGPLLVGVPVLADTRLAEGAVAFGIVMSAFGGGAFLGIILAGALPRPAPRFLGTLMMLLTSVFGVTLVVFGMTTSTVIIAIASLAAGAGSGYVNIVFVTWLQNRVPSSLLGRVMSLLMFASVGVVPVSQALCGALVAVSLPGVFIGAGVLLLAVTLRIMLVPAVRDMGLPPAQAPGDA